MPLQAPGSASAGTCQCLRTHLLVPPHPPLSAPSGTVECRSWHSGTFSDIDQCPSHHPGACNGLHSRPQYPVDSASGSNLSLSCLAGRSWLATGNAPLSALIVSGSGFGAFSRSPLLLFFFAFSALPCLFSPGVAFFQEGVGAMHICLLTPSPLCLCWKHWYPSFSGDLAGSFHEGYGFIIAHTYAVLAFLWRGLDEERKGRHRLTSPTSLFVPWLLFLRLGADVGEGAAGGGGSA